MTFFKIIGFCVISVMGLVALPNFAQGTEEFTNLEYGGPFELIDQTGRVVTNQDFLGQYMLIYFGYTSCPDICPTTLVRMASALKQLGEKSNAIQPIFVSVDSLRDTPEKLAPYVKAFHPRLVGLSGDSDAISAAASAYSVQYMAGILNGEYVVGHTGYLYLVGPDGSFIEKIPDAISPAKLAEKLRGYLDLNNG
jgi:cytochrome oxidase Cu insertion factor (SCO1/SenC/PrrC family)